jgi:hypothetical protein
VATLSGHSSDVKRLAFSPDGGRLVSASEDMTARIWETATWQAVIALHGHTDRVDDLAFSPDGHRIASASHDGTVRIWDAAPLTPSSRDERQAGRTVRYYLDRYGVRGEVIAAVRRDPSLPHAVRRRALALAEMAAEDPSRLNDESWAAVRVPGADPAAYLLALRKAERACELEPNDASYLGTLGTARYRTGDRKGAVIDLEKAISLRNADDPTNANEAFFIAMSHWNLGAKARAREWLDKAMQWEKQRGGDADLVRFRTEATSLIEGKTD